MKSLVKRLAIACAIATAANGLAATPTQSETSIEAMTSPSRDFALRINPIGWVTGAFGLEAQVGVLRNLSMGAAFTRFEENSGTRSTLVFEYDVLIDITPLSPRFDSGWWIQPSFRAIPSETSTRRVARASNTRMLAFSTGWQWLWDSGFHTVVGGGVGYFDSTADSGYQALLTAQLGWAF